MSEVTTVIFMLVILTVLLLFKDKVAQNMSNIFGAFEGPTPAVAPAESGGDGENKPE